jgi:hypothetical protein
MDGCPVKVGLVLGGRIRVGSMVRVSLVALGSMHTLPVCVHYLDRSSHLQVAV